MKILKIKADGLPLLQKPFEIDFLAVQRVTPEHADKMNLVFTAGNQSFYQNNVISLIGINASGKTTLLKLVTLICRMLNNEPINTIDCAEIMDGLQSEQHVALDIWFYADDEKIYLLHSVLKNKDNKIIIIDETLKEKPCTKVKNKKNLYDFDETNTVMRRSSNDVFLLEDVSIMVAFNRQNKKQIPLTDMLYYTNINQLHLAADFPCELIAFFDPSVEYLKAEKAGTELNIALKFKGKEEIKLHQLTDINRYLSSGTIKGINTFLSAMQLFRTGGYLVVDELENHFNHEIVSTLIRFYMDKKVNPRGAVLLFSTHYSELLDELDRNDSIYIVRNRGGITADNLSSLLKRNDIKKSDAYQSGFLEGTVPMYDAYMDLKKALIQSGTEGA